MKFSWGTGAFTLFGAFVLFMLGLVWFASRQSHELVTEDYYEKELLFKEVLKKKERTKELSEQLRWEISENRLTITFPKDVEGNTISGKVVFFKPSSEKDDKEILLQSESNSFSIDIADYARGMYKMRVNWEANNVEYYNEEVVVIP